MRFYTKNHQYYCGIDLHAKTMYVCILNAAGEMLRLTGPGNPATWQPGKHPGFEIVSRIPCESDDTPAGPVALDSSTGARLIHHRF